MPRAWPSISTSSRSWRCCWVWSSSMSSSPGRAFLALWPSLDRSSWSIGSSAQGRRTGRGKSLEEEAAEISYRHGSSSVLSLTHLGRFGTWHPQGPHPAKPHHVPLHFGGPTPGDGVADGGVGQGAMRPV